MPAAIPLALTAASAVAKGVSAHKAAGAQEKALRSQNALDEAWKKQMNAANQNILGQIGIENLLHPTSTSSSTSGGTSSTQSAFDQFTRPEVLAAYQGMEQQIKDLLLGRLGQAQTVTEAEKAAQIRNINAAYAGAAAQARNLAGKGMGAGQIGAAISPLAAARAGGIANYMATIPEIERRRQSENAQMAAQFMGQVGQGTRQSGTSTSRTNQSGWSQGSQTGPANVSALMALQQPVGGPQQTNQTGYSGWGTALGTAGDLAGAAASYYANRPNASTPNSPMQIPLLGQPNSYYPPGGVR